MRLLFAAFMMMHGLAHLVGFAVPWRLVTAAEQPYRTTILGGTVDLGDAGIRAIGVVWLLLAVAFVVAGAAHVTRQEWWGFAALAAASASLLLCVVSLPEARLGLIANALVIGLVMAGARFEWWSRAIAR